VQRTRAHLLADILIIGILSVICRGKGWEDMEIYGLSKQDWLKLLALPNGIPVQIPFDECLNALTPKYLSCFQRWVQSIVETLGAQVIPIDGKTPKVPYDREQGPYTL